MSRTSEGNSKYARVVRISYTLSRDTTANIGGIKFGQIFLAAPDINATLFKEIAYLYPQISERTTLYVSSKDKALDASYWIHDYPRNRLYTTYYSRRRD